MTACFLSNISAKGQYYKNPSMLSRVIAKNVGDVFWDTVYSYILAKTDPRSSRTVSLRQLSFLLIVQRRKASTRFLLQSLQITTRKGLHMLDWQWQVLLTGRFQHRLHYSEVCCDFYPHRVAGIKSPKILNRIRIESHTTWIEPRNRRRNSNRDLI